jgi:MFS family permease
MIRCTNYLHSLLTRFFLGVTEAPFYPGALWVLGIFYTRKEIATRISILYTGNILATAFAGLIALGIFEMDGLAGLSGWRWLFIIQGAATFAVAVGAAFILPDQPLTTKWLTEDERLLAHSRMTRDTVGASSATSSIRGLLNAAKVFYYPIIVRLTRAYVYAFRIPRSGCLHSWYVQQAPVLSESIRH